jgi:hypothetical protein
MSQFEDVKCDGIDSFRLACREMGIPVMDLIVRTARWVDPAAVAVLPVWYPAFYRGMELLMADWKRHNFSTRRIESERLTIARFGPLKQL